MVAAQPLFDLLQMLFLMRRAKGDINGNLMSAEGALDGFAVHHLRAGPALGSAQNDHRPLDVTHLLAGAGTFLDVVDLIDDDIQRIGHLGVHRHRGVALDEIGFPGAALEEALDFLMGHAAKDGGVGDLVAIQVQDGQHRTVAHGVQKFVGLPAGGQRASLGFAVAHGAGNDQIGVIEGCAEGMGDGVTQLAALVDGTRCFGGNVGGDAAGERELLEQFLHALFVTADVGVDFAVGAVQIGVGNKEVAAVTGAGDQNQVLVVLLDDAVQMHIDKVLAGHGTPVADDFALDVFSGRRSRGLSSR